MDMTEKIKVDLQPYIERIKDMDCMSYEGVITRVTGSIIEARSPAMSVGQPCVVKHGNGSGRTTFSAEVIGFREDITVLMPLEKMNGVQAGDRICSAPHELEIGLGEGLLGRVVDGLGKPIDGKGPVICPDRLPVNNASPHPLKRPPINEVFETGIRAVDVPLTLGKGQRVGVFSGAGVGKSTLLGEIARGGEADVNVICLVGERGREVGEFLRHNLGEDGLRKSVIVVGTADVPPLLKIKAAYTSTTIAEYMRDRGMNVLYMMDSITRVANAQREVGLAAGEPPTTRGYPPTAFSIIPELAERLGCSRTGSITGIYSVLVERDDFTEPVADVARATLDGHIAMGRFLADRGHYPAIDVLASVSRVMRELVTEKHLKTARKLKHALSTYREAEDLIKIGAYVKGSNRQIDMAIDLMPEINRFLCQDTGHRTDMETALADASEILRNWED